MTTSLSKPYRACSVYAPPQQQRATPPRIEYVDRWGAFAVNPKTGGFEFSFGESTKEQAKKLALERCGTKCVVQSVYSTQCIAYSFGQRKNGGKASYFTDKDPAVAERKSLERCVKSGAKNCQIKTVECSDNYPRRVK